MEVTTLEAGNHQQVQEVARQAAAVLSGGGLVVFPTETVYGVAASASDAGAIERLRALRAEGRPESFAVHLADPLGAERFVDTSSPALGRAIRKLLPGPVTLLVEQPEAVIREKLAALGLGEAVRDRLYRDQTVGLRVPDDALAQRVLASVSGPVVASAATRPGQAPSLDAASAASALGGEVDFVIDGGRCRYGKPSTVVRAAPGPSGELAFTVEREGVYDKRTVRRLLRWTLLLVCSGNTCRSPMAEALAKRMLAEARSIEPDELEAAGLRVVSAGAMTPGGAPATPEAVEAMQRQGIDLSGHRSRPLTPELIREADLILTMTEAHRQAVLSLAPDADTKTHRLDPAADVEDPIGSDTSAYLRTAEMIRRRLDARLKEQQ